MANMSYCRFENTSRDMADCLESLSNGIEYSSLSSDQEREGLESFLEMCKQVSEMIDDEGGMDEFLTSIGKED